MTNTSSIALSSFKYVYLIIFFTLISGIFYPLISNSTFQDVISGILILFLGLAGGVLLYKSTTSETKKEIFFSAGFALIGVSIFYIFEFAGKY